MEHVVFHPGADGRPAFGRFPSMAEAVSYVERLRNDDGVTEASLFALTPVPMVVRTVFRVEVPPVGDPFAADEPTHAEPRHAAYDVPGDDAVGTVPAQPDATPMESTAEQAESTDADPLVGVEPVTAAAEVVPAPEGRRNLGFFTH